VVCLHAPVTTANFDSYGNLSFDPCEFTLHTAVNAENNDCGKKTHERQTEVLQNVLVTTVFSISNI
jgi:hypothetical protein